jgi:hypothetical protein
MSQVSVFTRLLLYNVNHYYVNDDVGGKSEGVTPANRRATVAARIVVDHTAYYNITAAWMQKFRPG